ncbi:hypothetical protein CK203_001076 [Vitis vinifera]|uniref:DUF4283 domain-containing protein n=1 Tax=Vitis vinifera TaxID=29760 RepID=A0A438KMD4_VITVI|nr:hypothetical protein CK203_001076 [Vitis vinifera]
MRKKQDGEGSGRNRANILYVTRDKQSGGYIRLGVSDLERKHFCIFIPRGRKEKRGWKTMAEKIKEQNGLLGNPNAIAVKVKREESMGLLKKLEHCVVASRRGRVLLDFEDLEEARRVVSSGNRTMEGVQVGLDFWSPRSGCWTEEEKAKEFGRSGEEVYEIALWWECRPVIRRSSRQADGRCSSEVGGEESSRAEKRVTKGWVSVRLETCIRQEMGRVGRGLFGSNEGRAQYPVLDSIWCSPPFKPNASQRIKRGRWAWEEWSNGIKMKRGGLSPEQARRGGPIFFISRPRPEYLSEEGLTVDGADPGKTHAPEPFVAWETEDLRKLNGVARISETDKALEEESMRAVLKGAMDAGRWEQRKAAVIGRGILEVGAIYDTQTERGMQEDKWEESDLAKFSQFLGFPTEGLEKEILKFLSQIRKRREKIHKRLGTGQRAPDCDCPMKMKILSWNVRGANDSSKRKVIKTFIRNQRVDVICIQETKIQAMSDNIARSIGSGRFLEWKAVNAEGASGGF